MRAALSADGRVGTSVEESGIKLMLGLSGIGHFYLRLCHPSIDRS